MANIYLTVRLINQTEMKVGHSELVRLCGKFITQQIKGTPGDNRLMVSESSYRRDRLAPRCRLIASWS